MSMILTEMLKNPQGPTWGKKDFQTPPWVFTAWVLYVHPEGPQQVQPRLQTLCQPPRLGEERSHIHGAKNRWVTATWEEAGSFTGHQQTRPRTRKGRDVSGTTSKPLLLRGPGTESPPVFGGWLRKNLTCDQKCSLLTSKRLAGCTWSSRVSKAKCPLLPRWRLEWRSGTPFLEFTPIHVHPGGRGHLMNEENL